MTQRWAAVSPRLKARVAGAFYLLTILLGAAVLFLHGWLGVVADLIATVSYVVVTALFYDLFRAVNRNLSLLAVPFNPWGSLLGNSTCNLRA